MTMKHLLMTTTLVAAMGLSAVPAAAFDESTWTWTKNQTDQGSRSTGSWLWAFPDGETAVESRQTTYGNATAGASIDSQITPPEVDSSMTIVPANDAVADMPAVEGSAAAYGNVISIESDVPISADVGQYHAGGYDPAAATAADALSTIESTTDPVLAGDTMETTAERLEADARSGALLPHETRAAATATGITQATVDLEARAISNSSSMTLTAAPPADASLGGDGGATLDAGQAAVYPRSTNALLTSDETQFSYGNTSAEATSSQTISNMTGLGTLSQPVNRVGASAIGNLATYGVKITAPDAPVN